MRRGFGCSQAIAQDGEEVGNARQSRGEIGAVGDDVPGSDLRFMLPMAPVGIGRDRFAMRAACGIMPKVVRHHGALRARWLHRQPGRAIRAASPRPIGPTQLGGSCESDGSGGRILLDLTFVLWFSLLLGKSRFVSFAAFVVPRTPRWSFGGHDQGALFILALGSQAT